MSVAATIFRSLLLVTTLVFALPCAHAAEADARANCLALAKTAAPNFRVDTAEWVAAGNLASGPNGATTPVPAHCLFRVTLDPRTADIPDMSYGIGLELRLPLQWSGRLLFQGGGGLNGVLIPALGPVSGAPSALQRGFVVVSTDGGHRGRNNIDSRFGVDQQAKLDFGYVAVQRGVREAKALIDRYYGKRPQYTYFMGCSTGGREGMMAAQNSPMEFDGIVAGNPSWNLTKVAMNQVWSLQTVTKIAPKGADGKPQLSAAFTDTQLQAVANAVLKQCDALDGLADGMINDFKACKFDPASLQCGTGTNKDPQQCLSPAQVGALKDITGGARNSRGESLYGSTPYDTGIAQPAWRGMHLGTGNNPPANATLGRDTLRLFSLTPPQPELDPLAFNFDTAVAATAETAAINDPTGVLHSSFVSHGGKLIVYHGLSDQAMWTGALTGWYDKLLPRDAKGPQAWARLFLVAGMTHCGGGQSTDEFDLLTAIMDWVEHDKAPDRVSASGKAFPGVTRPLCPYPKVARYDSGDVKDETSFSCRE
ncbi:MAG TPA: tannase/feruloyl esterase family alpha/beta hydrolase [Candidatus Acidoferrum sp.]|nr:tannase/feruloyl esterase family alpha/beta hydrolase [Candidatus Acidoferrum sp.]